MAQKWHLASAAGVIVWWNNTAAYSSWWTLDWRWQSGLEYFCTDIYSAGCLFYMKEADMRLLHYQMVEISLHFACVCKPQGSMCSKLAKLAYWSRLLQPKWNLFFCLIPIIFKTWGSIQFYIVSPKYPQRYRILSRQLFWRDWLRVSDLACWGFCIFPKWVNRTPFKFITK